MDKPRHASTFESSEGTGQASPIGMTAFPRRRDVVPLHCHRAFMSSLVPFRGDTLETPLTPQWQCAESGASTCIGLSTEAILPLEMNHSPRVGILKLNLDPAIIVARGMTGSQKVLALELDIHLPCKMACNIIGCEPREKKRHR